VREIVGFIGTQGIEESMAGLLLYRKRKKI
jgi:hypothetical protein